jgi:epsilon-lactone hydrolase
MAPLSAPPLYVPTGGKRKPSGFTLRGRASFRLRNVWLLFKVSLAVTVRRLLGRPRVRGWSWNFECANLFLQAQMKHSFTLPNPADARAFLDALTFNPLDDPAVVATPARPGEPRGTWYVPKAPVANRTMLYLHGGGYAFYARSHAPMIALLADATAARTFALDYRLTPEHPHPAQLEDSLAAYRWLLQQGVNPTRLIVAGDSAGGHLALMTLLELRRLGLPQPALAIGICPWTDIGNRGASLFANQRFDWIQGDMALQFGAWYRGHSQLPDAELSPIYADLRGLAPLYLQAGDKEVLHDMIQEFVAIARQHGAAITLDVWKNMTHDFQAYGSFIPESAEALQKLHAQVDEHLGTSG